MKKKIVMMALLFLAGMLTAAFGESTVTLKSGEVLKGDILSDTNGLLQIRVYSANRTISSRRSVPRSDIEDIQKESPAQAAERVDYFALPKFQLNPDQEQSTDFYTQLIAAFEKFLKDYPKSDKTTTIQQRIEVYQTELRHVANGEVKFGNKWMTPEEKKPQALNKQLTELESQRDSLAVAIGEKKGQLAALQMRLQTFIVHDSSIGGTVGGTHYTGDTEEPIYGTRDDGSPNHYSVRYIVGYRKVPNPERVSIQEGIEACQKIIGSGEPVLARLDAKIQSIKIQIEKAERDYQNRPIK